MTRTTICLVIFVFFGVVLGTASPATAETWMIEAEVTFPASMTFSSAGAALRLFDDDGADDEAAIIEHDLALGTLQVQSGTLGGSGAVTVSDAFSITSGTIDNRSVTITGVGSIGSSGTIRLTGGTSVTNDADLNVDTITMADGTAWTNNATLTVDPGNGFPTTGTITTPPTVTNNGLVVVDFGDVSLGAEWINNGELRTRGTVTATGTFTNAVGGTVSGTGRLDWSGAPTVTNDGTVAPGRPDLPYASWRWSATS